MKMGGSAQEIEFLCWVAGEWLFPAVLLADFYLAPINLADQFVIV